MTYVDLGGINRLRAKLAQIKRINPTPLAYRLMKVIDEGNKRGVLMGLDKDGRSMPPVKYRPVTSKPAKLTPAQKNSDNARKRKGTFSGFGPAAAGLNNNLLRSEYERLSGPPLAPRGAFSRVITNLRTEFSWDESTRELRVSAAWFEVVSTKGRQFLPAHFTGERVGRGKGFRLPVRNLAGVRPWDVTKARETMVAFMRDQIRFHLRS